MVNRSHSDCSHSRDRLRGRYLIEQSQIWPLTNEQVSQRELHDISFNLYDLLRGRKILEHRVFTRCIIYGPAVIEILGNDTFFYRPHWLVPPEIPQNKQADSVFLALPVGTFISGAIFVRHCEFRDCKFQSIQILGTEEQREKFRKSIATAEANHGNDIP